MVEHLPSVCNDLALISSTQKKKQFCKKQGQGKNKAIQKKVTMVR